ncbi:hypothetical protein F5X96DRAFT_483022 [Biscogniauxia mediterranea]|nr:hypothetical protein F5X96DRAFT_483022 [Biscogniauxia mediterranea]
MCGKLRLGNALLICIASAFIFILYFPIIFYFMCLEREGRGKGERNSGWREGGEMVGRKERRRGWHDVQYSDKGSGFVDAFIILLYYLLSSVVFGSWAGKRKGRMVG